MNESTTANHIRRDEHELSPIPSETDRVKYMQSDTSRAGIHYPCTPLCTSSTGSVSLD
jgi:hypothetical protein